MDKGPPLAQEQSYGVYDITSGDGDNVVAVMVHITEFLPSSTLRAGVGCCVG